MKKILRDTCLLASLIILAVFGLSIIWSGITAEIKLVFEIFGLAFIISVLRKDRRMHQAGCRRRGNGM